MSYHGTSAWITLYVPEHAEYVPFFLFCPFSASSLSCVSSSLVYPSK